MRTELDILDRCVERVRQLPFVRKATVLGDTRGWLRRADAVLKLVTPDVTEEFVVEVKRTHLTRAVVDGVLAQAARHAPKPWILFAPHVGRPLARYLGEQGANFVDVAGNCRLRVGSRYLAAIEGRPEETRPLEARGAAVPGHQVLFALLVRTELADAPVRTLAVAAGVGHATAAGRMARLTKDGLVHRTEEGRRLTEPRRLLDMWLKGYETLVRPRLLAGRYRTDDADPITLERRIERALDDKMRWAFGGGAAANRLTGYYRGTDTVVHVEQPATAARALRALRADDGPLILLGAPGPLAFEGAAPRTVAPLLVYTELLLAGDRRARDAAGEILQKFLGHLA